MNLTINISKEAVLVLEELVKSGVYGSSPEEIAEGFVKYGVQGFVDRPSFSIPLLVKEDRLRELDRDDKRSLLKPPISAPFLIKEN
jgi:hypothetical protein